MSSYDLEEEFKDQVDKFLDYVANKYELDFYMDSEHEIDEHETYWFCIKVRSIKSGAEFVVGYTNHPYAGDDNYMVEGKYGYTGITDVILGLEDVIKQYYFDG